MKLTIQSRGSAGGGTVETSAAGLVITGPVREFVDHYRGQFANENARQPKDEELPTFMRTRMWNRSAVHAYLDGEAGDPNAALLD
jgi:hypothetical protein